MFRSALFRLTLLFLGFTLAISSLHANAQDKPDIQRRGRKYKAPPPASRIEVSVVRDANGKPIEHAAVIFHPIEGDKDKGVMELKTNFDGKASIDVIPIGDTVRLQVIARGFQTYGEEYKIDKDAMNFEIRMKRPGEQYSIYKEHSQAENSGSTGEEKSPKEAKPPVPPNEADNQASPNKTQPRTN